MEDAPDPVIRTCHSNTCSRSFIYTPTPEAIAAGFADTVDKMACAREGWTRSLDDDGRTVHYCARCTREDLPGLSRGR
jgi:hypothetical protein